MLDRGTALKLLAVARLVGPPTFARPNTGSPYIPKVLSIAAATVMDRGLAGVARYSIAHELEPDADLSECPVGVKWFSQILCVFDLHEWDETQFIHLAEDAANSLVCRIRLCVGNRASIVSYPVRERNCRMPYLDQAACTQIRSLNVSSCLAHIAKRRADSSVFVSIDMPLRIGQSVPVLNR
jgi:hypothetical protein